jgi:hypothetical protein
LPSVTVSRGDGGSFQGPISLVTRGERKVIVIPTNPALIDWISRRRMIAAALAVMALAFVSHGQPMPPPPGRPPMPPPRHEMRPPRPSGPMAGTGRKATGDGMAVAGFGSQEDGGGRSGPLPANTCRRYLRYCAPVQFIGEGRDCGRRPYDL